jgi:hypothetical protein
MIAGRSHRAIMRRMKDFLICFLISMNYPAEVKLALIQLSKYTNTIKKEEELAV